eukprot:TRINITY_DN68009_c0_g4_i1.p1 TRINITY_DN68009_c0_g4~~TRINITY_DN68009_c0_g4_i1.p1  ORF type:complete len:361 (+),score=39.93 TRINITY_DN68009_c0_g4_i1:19-1101(+)
MSDRSQLENILSTAGLPAPGVQQCLDIFEKEMITPAVLPQLSTDDFRDMGILTGYRRLLFDHLHGTNAPIHHYLLSLCLLLTQRGCWCLVCNDCASVGDHRTHKVVDSQKGISVLRSQLAKWQPSNNLETQIRTQQAEIATLRSQLAEAEDKLKKLQQQQEQTTARARIAQSLSQTETVSCGPDAVNALKQLHQLVTSLGDLRTAGIRFTTIIGQGVEVTEGGRKVRFTGTELNTNVGVIDPHPINTGDGVIEWAVLPKSNYPSNHFWVGFGVIPVCDIPELNSKDVSTVLHGWSTNSFQYPGAKRRNFDADNRIMRLRLDCEKATLTLNDGEAIIENIPFPVHCFAAMTHPNNELSVID